MSESKKNKKKKTTFSAQHAQSQLHMPSVSELEYNSMVYAAALQNPWDAEPGVRIPDKGSAESATVVGHKIGTAAVITGSTSGFASGVFVYPYAGFNSTVAKAHRLSAMVDISTTPTWAPDTWDTAEPDLAANARSERVVAMGVEWFANGTEQNLNTRYFCGYTNRGNISASNYTITDFATLPNAIEYTFEQMLQGVRMVWLPSQYGVTHDATDISMPAAAWHSHQLPIAEYDPLEWVPFCVGIAADANGGGIAYKTITHYEYVPDYEDSQSVTTATVYGDADAIEMAKQSILPQGKANQLRKVGGKIIKAASNFLQSNTGAKMAANLIKVSPLGGPIARINKVMPKSLKQVAGRLPIVGGLLGNLFSSRARRLIVMLGLNRHIRDYREHEQIVQRLAEILEEHSKAPTKLIASLQEEVLMLTRGESRIVVTQD